MIACTLEVDQIITLQKLVQRAIDNEHNDLLYVQMTSSMRTKEFADKTKERIRKLTTIQKSLDTSLRLHEEINKLMGRRFGK